MNVDFSELEDVVCNECSSVHFEQVYLLKKVPALISPISKETLAPAQIFRCADCKCINEELMPK
jgi:hypothetical protein